MTAFNYDPNENFGEHSQLSIENMEFVCVYCRALKFHNESVGLCCSGGKFYLEPLGVNNLNQCYCICRVLLF